METRIFEPYFETGEFQNSKTINERSAVVPENCQSVMSTTKGEQGKSGEAVTTGHSQSGTRKNDRFEMVSCDLAHLVMGGGTDDGVAIGDQQRGADRELYGIADRRRAMRTRGYFFARKRRGATGERC
jgi:hypothetical protein